MKGSRWRLDGKHSFWAHHKGAASREGKRKHGVKERPGVCSLEKGVFKTEGPKVVVWLGEGGGGLGRPREVWGEGGGGQVVGGAYMYR